MITNFLIGLSLIELIVIVYLLFLISKKNKKSNEMKQSQINSEKTVEQLQNELKSVTKKNTELKKKLSNFETEQKIQLEKNSELSNELIRLKKENKLLSKQVDNLSSENQRLNGKTDDLNKKNNEEKLNKSKFEKIPPKKEESNIVSESVVKYETTPKTTQRKDVKSHKSSNRTNKHNRKSDSVFQPSITSDTGQVIEEIIPSEPNPEQTNELKIKYNPNDLFLQQDKYKYPVVKMPKKETYLKLPRVGRSNRRGYKEKPFFEALKTEIKEQEINTEFHLTIPYYSKPYEPDIVVFDKNLNLYIDIEIDEPYDGYYRYPTHEEGKDDTRDLFFTESGWIVIRFTEKQIHEQQNECIKYIKSVINSIYVSNIKSENTIIKENQWDYQQAIRWEKEYFREKYLGIDKFYKQKRIKEIATNPHEFEEIETVISRTRKFETGNTNTDVSFDEELHIYRQPSDVTGNATYISVTTLIDRFFPFDLQRFVQRKAADENRSEKEVLEEYIKNRDEAAEKGTYLHKQIENFLTGKEYDKDLKEFLMFQKFYNEIIIPKSFEFVEAEKQIMSERYNIAGTIDALFKKSNKDEYIILDWKRSKKLVIDGHPRIFGYGQALSDLSHLDNSSYNKYLLQQNIYRYILENIYGLKVSSMKLVVLHEKYDTYHIVSLDKINKEILTVLNSPKYKI